VEKRRRGVLAVHDHVVGEARAQAVDGPIEQSLGGAVLAVSRSVMLDIEGRESPVPTTVIKLRWWEYPQT